MAALALEGITKTFAGRVAAVRDLSLDVRDGELLSILGPSGCGKSTLLSIVAGLDAPDAGVVRIGGRVVNDLSPGERDVAMVFQSYALYPHMDVRGNLEFPLEVARLERRAIAARVEEVAALLDLAPVLSRRPGELSGGQRQRVALGRALVRRPKLFLLDEPLSNVDAALRGSVRAELKKLHERLGATFVYVTHDQAEALTISDRVAVLRDGALQQLGTPREIYAAPANAFVASFVGSPPLNLVPPEVLGLAGPGLLAGVRPEHLSISPGAGAAGLRASVWLVEPAGPDTWVTVDLAGTRLVARCGMEFAAPVGAAVRVIFEAERVHWFDRDSGRRIERPINGSK